MSQAQHIEFKLAEPKHAPLIASLVFDLTREISERTGAKQFDLDLPTLTRQCRDFLERGFYQALLAYREGEAVAVATVAETYALYAGGKIGVLQEFYVAPAYRSDGLGTRLMERVLAMGEKRGWAAYELCTPPLPEFDDTLKFYQAHGFQAVGGRKMRMSRKADGHEQAVAPESALAG